MIKLVQMLYPLSSLFQLYDVQHYDCLQTFKLDIKENHFEDECE